MSMQINLQHVFNASVRPTFSETVMLSVGVSKLGCTELFFVEPGVKINGTYYRDVLLTQKLLPVIRQISVNWNRKQHEVFIFWRVGFGIKPV